METPLTLLYTGGLRGDLALLPRLYTFLRRLRAAERARTLLLDAGGACNPAVWHCAVTGGRSMLIALDGMGYDAAHAALTAGDRAKLGAAVRLAVVDAAHPAQIDGVRVAETPDASAALTILLPADVKSILEGRTLKLARVKHGDVGRIRLIPAGVPLSIHMEADALPLPPETPPDPTIAGVIDFILSEADYARRRQAR